MMKLFCLGHPLLLLLLLLPSYRAHDDAFDGLGHLSTHKRTACRLEVHILWPLESTRLV